MTKNLALLDLMQRYQSNGGANENGNNRINRS